MPHPNEQKLRTIYAALGRGDVPALLALLTHDVRYHISGRSLVSGDYVGHDGVVKLLTKFNELSEGTFSVQVLDILANDQHGVAFTMERARRNGRTLENRAVHVYEFAEKVRRFWGYNEKVWDDFWV
jgi:ketosteroid isomerase-like protein